MSNHIVPDERPLHGKKPDFKFRPGFDFDQLEDFLQHQANDRHFAKRALLQAMGHTPQDLDGVREGKP